MGIKKDIVLRVRIFWSFLAFLALIVVGRIVSLQMTDVSELGAKAVRVYMEEEPIVATRGKIYTKDGSLLACSLPYFQLGIDVSVAAVTDSIFREGVDSLALCLSELFGDKTQQEYLKILKEARAEKEIRGYHSLGRRLVTYTEAKKIEKYFPIFRRGKYKGGLVLDKELRRYHPLGMIGERTLGKLEEVAKGVKVGSVGLEDAYESELKGVNGIRGKRIAPRRRTDFIIKEAIAGNDIVTTFDVDIQDVTENALLQQLKKFKAHHGTAVVMEVSTGEVKAIANLGIAADGNYYERWNYAIADAVEPGSVFKLPSMIALLEEGTVKLTDSINTGNGTKKFYGATMRDSHACGKITVQEVFEKSSNVGTSMLVHKTFKNNPQKYIDRLYDLHLAEPINLKIQGEGKPYIKDTKSKAWWKTSLPWMSIGYEVNITPLQMLTLYNAVANNGKMVKPKMVYAIERNGKLIRDFSEPVVVDYNICSEETLKKLHVMLEGVVERGTATNIKDKRYKISGKTGTAHLMLPNGKGYDFENYRATFVGYFPADAPKYSCIVVVEKPDKEIGYFGGTVSAPVFKKIADALYAKGKLAASQKITFVDGQHSQKLMLLAGLNKGEVIKRGLGEKFVKNRRVVYAAKGKMPNVLGMSVAEALFLLESRGIEVALKGNGVIQEQSVKAGATIHRGDKVTLTLS